VLESGLHHSRTYYRRVGLGFAVGGRARHITLPNRVHLRYGLTIHLLLLSTPPHDDAVTFGYRTKRVLERTFTSHDCVRSQAHPPAPLAARSQRLIGYARTPA
jgi:hypothetical protein